MIKKFITVRIGESKRELEIKARQKFQFHSLGFQRNAIRNCTEATSMKKRIRGIQHSTGHN